MFAEENFSPGQPIFFRKKKKKIHLPKGPTSMALGFIFSFFVHKMLIEILQILQN